MSNLQESKKESSINYEVLVENTSDLISILKEDLTVNYINKAAHLELLNYSENEILGNNLKDLVDFKDFVKISDTFRNSFDLGEATVEARLRHKKGHYIWFELKIRTFFDKNQDNICAMTGDGINDSLAMKVADASIALGISGTDVAKETADMIISDDNFVSIENGVKIGRSLFSKIRVIVYFFICINLAEGFIFFMYEFYPYFTLFTSEWQHVYIYGIVHSLPALALVLDKFPKDVMQEPPRKNEEILSSAMWKMLLINAIFIVLGLFLVLQFSLMSIIPLNEWNLNPQLSFIPKNSTYQNLIEQKARTMFITTIYIIETSFIWSFRRPNKYLYQSLKNDFSFDVLAICLFTLGIHVLVINFSYYLNSVLNYVYDLNINLNLMFLSLQDWIICIIFSLPAIFGIEIYKYLAKKKNIFF